MDKKKSLKKRFTDSVTREETIVSMRSGSYLYMEARLKERIVSNISARNVFSIGKLSVSFCFIALLLFSVTEAQQMQNPCTKEFCLADAGGEGTFQTIALCAGTNTTVRNFNLWWQNTTDGTYNGPLNLSNGGILSGVYDNDMGSILGGQAYSDVSGLNASTVCIDFTLNATRVPLTKTTAIINATTFGNASWALAPSNAKTFFTINYVSLQALDASGNTDLGNAIFMSYNDITKSFVSSGPASTDKTGYYALHCKGAVIGPNCVGANNSESTISNSCFVHGIQFPVQGGQPATNNCEINSSTAILVFDFLSSNGSIITNITPGTYLPLKINNSVIVGFANPQNYNPTPGPGGFENPNITNLNVTNYTTGALVYTAQISQGGGQGPKGGMPFFLNVTWPYRINMDISNTGFRSYVFMGAAAGMIGAEPIVANSSITQYTTFIGKVVDENNAPVGNAVVYAQFSRQGGGGFGINFFNSSLTDGNGKFSIRVPTTQFVATFDGMGTFPYPAYQFYIISDKKSAQGFPIHFPTTDNNNGKGYFAQPVGGNAILPPIKMRAGGQVSVNVTLNGASLALSELSRFLSIGTGLTRDGVTGKFTMMSIFQGVSNPASIVIPFLSPINSVVVNIMGKNSTFGGQGGGPPGQSNPFIGGCFNSTSVTQGQLSQINCNLTMPGKINLTVTTCNEVITRQGCMDEQLGNFNFWFDTGVALYNDSNARYMLSTEGMFFGDLVGFGASSGNVLSIPVPSGYYKLELVPTQDFSRHTGVSNGTVISVGANQTFIAKILRGQKWMFEPKFNPSLAFSTNNIIDITLKSMDQSLGGVLTDAYVNLNGTKILFPNKTDAAPGKTITFSYDPTYKYFRNATFNPKAFGLQSGKYWLMFNATFVNGTSWFTSTQLMPITAFDFQAGTDFGGFVFGTGVNVSAKAFAYNSSSFPPTGVAASPANISVRAYDQSGAEVSIAYTTAGITNGQGIINLTMPTTVGFYEVVTTITTDRCTPGGSCNNGTVGVSTNWIQVSNFNVKTQTDKPRYQPSDKVSLTVQVTNSSSGSGVSGATVQISVDNSNTPAIGVSDANGKASFVLNPATYGTNSQWSFGFHQLKIKISKETGTDIIKLESFFGFDVRGLDAFIQPSRPVFQTSENVIINVFVPPHVSVSSITATVDGSSTDIAQGSQSGPGFWNVNLSTRNAGHHDVKIALADMSGNSQTFFTGFDVSAFNIIASTDKFTYNAFDKITLTVKAAYPNGTAVIANTPVIATLYKAQPPNDIQVDNKTNTTIAGGSTTLKLDANQTGFNYMKVNVGGQVMFVGVQVSSLKVSLLSGTAGIPVTNYNGAPGSTVTIYVNATSGSSDVADGSTVTAKIWAFGNPIDLPSNTTTKGNTTVSFTIPSFAPSQSYGLEVRVTTPTGEQGFAPPATLRVTGGSALKLTTNADRGFLNPYGVGDTGTLTAFITNGSGSGLGGYNVTFEMGSEGTKPQVIGTAFTGATGVATRTFSVNSNFTDGQYFIHAFITNSTDIQAYGGFIVSSLRVNASPSKTKYSPGENITLFISVYNRTSGSQVNATAGSVSLFNKEKGKIDQSFTPSGLQPYIVNINVPNEASAVGTYPMRVSVQVNSSRAEGFLIVDVINQSLTLGLDVPNVTAGSPFIFNISSSVNGSATVKVFSPSASSMIYDNNSVPLSTLATPNATINLTISQPGVYVIGTFVNGIGTSTKIITVAPPTSGAVGEVWTGTSVSANATTFTTSQDVYILSNIANATATVLTLNTTTNSTIKSSVPLSLTTGSNYYGVFSGLASGNKYFVRLDTATASGIAKTLFTVS